MKPGHLNVSLTCNENFYLLIFTDLLRSLGTWFSHQMIVTPKYCTMVRFLNNHLAEITQLESMWSEMLKIGVTDPGEHTSWLTQGINPCWRWWTAGHQGGSEIYVISPWNTRSQSNFAFFSWSWFTDQKANISVPAQAMAKFLLTLLGQQKSFQDLTWM